MTNAPHAPWPEPVIRPARAADAEAIADLYLASRADASPYLGKLHPDNKTRAWIKDIVVARGGAWVVIVESRIVGFVSVVEEDLDQLYVSPAWYRRGVGSALLERAKSLSPSGLHLSAFQRNARARAFYQAHGFTVFDFNDGERNEEKEPDAQYEWQGVLTRRLPRSSGG